MTKKITIDVPDDLYQYLSKQKQGMSSTIRTAVLALQSMDKQYADGHNLELALAIFNYLDVEHAYADLPNKNTPEAKVMASKLDLLKLNIQWRLNGFAELQQAEQKWGVKA